MTLPRAHGIEAAHGLTRLQRQPDRGKPSEPTRNHKPNEYIRGQGAMASSAVNQAACRLCAEDLPVYDRIQPSKEAPFPR